MTSGGLLNSRLVPFFFLDGVIITWLSFIKLNNSSNTLLCINGISPGITTVASNPSSIKYLFPNSTALSTPLTSFSLKYVISS